MLLRDILETKGKHVYTISPDESLQDVVTKLVRWNCGSLLVVDANRPEHMLGIITERDILRACAAGKFPLSDHRVREAMTATPLAASPYQTVEDAMGVMTTRRIRHLPHPLRLRPRGDPEAHRQRQVRLPPDALDE